MPEICEAEIISNRLHQNFRFSTVSDVLFDDSYCSRKSQLPIIGMRGWTISSIERSGKMIVFKFENPGAGNRYLLNSLGMTGRWSMVEGPGIKSWACSIKFCDGRTLSFFDKRKFGFLRFAEKLQDFDVLKNLGIDPLSDQFSDEYVKFCTIRHLAPIKALLLRPEYFPGVGNWVANEALFRANLHPQTPGRSLTLDQISRLRFGLIAVIMNGINMGGATIKDWLNADGKPGTAQLSFNVYGRENKPCNICGAKIVREKICGRSCFFCPSCQKSDWSPVEISGDFVKKIVGLMEG